MAKLKQHFYDLIVLVSMFLYPILRYDIFFLIVVTVYAVALTYDLRRYDNVLIMTRYQTPKEYKQSTLQVLLTKSIVVAIILTFLIAFSNFFSKHYTQYNYLLIVMMYFCFFSVLSISIYWLKISLGKTMIILFIFMIALFFQSPITFFVQLLVNDYFWSVPLNLIKNNVIWIILLIATFIFSYVVDGEGYL